MFNNDFFVQGVYAVIIEGLLPSEILRSKY